MPSRRRRACWSGARWRWLAATALPREERVHLARARCCCVDAEAYAAAGGEQEYALAAARGGPGRRSWGGAVGPALEARATLHLGRAGGDLEPWIEETRAWSRAAPAARSWW